MNEELAARLKRMAAANRRATLRRLRAMSLDEGLREFEQLTREVEKAFGDRLAAAGRTRPAGFIKRTRERK